MMSLADASRQGFPVVVGVDAEWVPFAFLDQGVDGGNRRQRVCVLQISTRDLAVVVDLCAWMAGHGTEGEEKLEELASVILREDILKVGFGIALDVKMLRESFPGVSCFHRFDELTQRQWGYLDIHDMVLALLLTASLHPQPQQKGAPWPNRRRMVGRVHSYAGLRRGARQAAHIQGRRPRAPPQCRRAEWFRGDDGDDEGDG